MQKLKEGIKVHWRDKLTKLKELKSKDKHPLEVKNSEKRAKNELEKQTQNAI